MSKLIVDAIVCGLGFIVLIIMCLFSVHSPAPATRPGSKPRRRKGWNYELLLDKRPYCQTIAAECARHRRHKCLPSTSSPCETRDNSPVKKELCLRKADPHLPDKEAIQKALMENEVARQRLLSILCGLNTYKDAYS
ncbi:unnamed protein product [Hermetia illucens]|uniref:Uncharacterized protein n=1 Tax=Hermetia illucens TaxID=343691 RepID=A0A7R8YPC4_HERIL|nr:unnamed protein product [Hermetia illucens]